MKAPGHEGHPMSVSLALEIRYPLGKDTLTSQACSVTNTCNHLPSVNDADAIERLPLARAPGELVQYRNEQLTLIDWLHMTQNCL